MTSIYINYDFREDLKPYQDDVDKDSSTLKSYHKELWQKKLPNGDVFTLSDDTVGEGFIFQTNPNPIRLSSDWMINTYLHWDTLKELKKQVNPDDYDNFNDIAHTIGNYILFPKYPLNTSSEKRPINPKRGTDNKIKDRFDLTLECIRRYYFREKGENPLYEVINDFDYYFDLFEDFKGFCDFYLLQDLTNDNYSEIKWFLEFHGFKENPYPKEVDEYNEYMKNAMEFINKRNKRILEYTLGEEIFSILNMLSSIEHDILKMRFGILDGCPIAIEEVATHFNVQREQIRQIEAKAFRRLRHPKHSRRIGEIIKIIKESNWESSHFRLFFETLENGNKKVK